MIKKILYAVAGIISLSLIISHDTFAIDYDTSKLGAYLFKPSESYIEKSDYSNMYFQQCASPDPCMQARTSLNAYSVLLKFDRVIPKNSMLNVFYYAHSSSSRSSFALKAYGGKAYVYDHSYLNSNMIALNQTFFNSSETQIGADAVNLKLIVTEDTDELRLVFDPPPTGWLLFTPGSYIGLSSGAADAAAKIDNQTQKQEEQWKKEEEQRKKDEEKSEQSSKDASSGSDSAQSDVDSKTSSLFDILKQFVSAITGASGSSCNINANFGFFDEGQINICTGGSSVRPITTVVGSIMLLFLVVSGVIAVINQFKSLYMEFTS